MSHNITIAANPQSQSFGVVAREYNVELGLAIGMAIGNSMIAVSEYFRNREAKRHLRQLPEYLLEDIGVSRDDLI